MAGPKTAPPSARGQDRRDRIIAAAIELFAARGYNGVGVRQVADAAGIQMSTIYHYFPSKEQLLHAISLDYVRDYVEDTAELMQGPEPPPERLRLLIHRHVAYFHAHREQEAVGLREIDQLTPEHRHEIRAYQRVYQERFRDIIAEGVDRGEFDVPDVELATLAILGLVNSLNQWLRGRGRLSVKEVAAAYATMALRILGVTPPPAGGA